MKVKTTQITKIKILCPSCDKNVAIIDDHYGVTFCKICRNEDKKIPELGVEWTTDSIKDQRQEYRKDILQPWMDGVLSKEYVEEYGDQGVDATKEDIKNAKYTYKGTRGWWNRHKSKGGKRR